ncbi:LysE family transporter [uncultured Williamsia sp.]|uniref:LysE/ArgO family amino acid transporter n=1 Tax=uncultured Williamsia sp. TaxID=259311 RepID=UPI0026071BC0|nr:LysE family transporter [uncultured Williamsia sp.]
MTWFSTALAGLLTGAGLIIAIGPQNVMVLRTGVARTHVRSVVAVCATSDIVLILGGVAGLGTVVSGHPSLVVVATVLGGGYVIVLGLLAARRSFRAWRGGGESLTVGDEGRQVTRTAVVATALLLTFGNPHVYLDTVLTLGAVANAHGPDLRWAFGLGACAASILWFAALGFGAGRLAPWFARPRAWQILDAVIAVVMISFGAVLIGSLLH